MIINKNIEIKLTNRNKTKYKNKGYDVSGDIIYLCIDDLSRNSQIKIKAKCDICGKEKEITYQLYMNSYENNNMYACSLICGREKAKKTNLEKYGVENVSQSEKIKEKKKETNMLNWGTENVFQNDEIKQLSKKTKYNKYGDENYTNREKCWETCKKNNGVKYPMQSKDILEKRNKNNKEKFGRKYYTQTDDYKKQSIETCLEKYGVEYYLQSKDKKEKSIKTCNMKYNVDYPMQSEEIKEKMKETKIKTGSYLSDKQRTDYQNYRLKVDSITKKYKEKLFDNWNGKDYYDGTYIRDNFSLDSGDKLYPTIDHKISVKYGFDNNIPPEEIGRLKNLCITKRTINSSKSSKNKY